MKCINTCAAQVCLICNRKLGEPFPYYTGNQYTVKQERWCYMGVTMRTSAKLFFKHILLLLLKKPTPLSLLNEKPHLETTQCESSQSYIFSKQNVVLPEKEKNQANKKTALCVTGHTAAGLREWR